MFALPLMSGSPSGGPLCRKEPIGREPRRARRHHCCDGGHTDAENLPGQSLCQRLLAERIFVSRQTISNWVTGRTYLDVQSLLLMSDLFDTSIDEHVNGDMEAMEKAIENDWKTMSRLAIAAWLLIAMGYRAFLPA